MPQIDVVIVSYNSRDHLRPCVTQLAQAKGVRVTVVDSASSDGCLETIADLSAVRIPLPENRGFAYACNEGIRCGAAPYVLLLNPDTRLDPDALRAMVNALEAEPRRGAVGPRIIREDGTLHFSIRRFPRASSSFAQAFFLHRFWPKARWVDELIRDPDRYQSPGHADWVSGACILLRRTAIEELGGLDAGFFLYREDVDLCRRLWDAGWEVWFDPRAACIHEGGASQSGESLLGVLAASRIRYARKHGSATEAWIERIGVAVGAATHALVTGGPRRAGHLHAFRIAVRDSPDGRVAVQ